jgi:hypothetical protein
MKNIEELIKSKAPIVAIDSHLNKLIAKKPFPKKLNLANEKLKDAILPSPKTNFT